jgi:putative flippase GtrA
MDIDFLLKIGLFSLVGAGTFALDAGLSFFLMRRLAWPLLFANSTGFLFGKIINFFANRRFTFHSEDPQVLKQAIFFFSIVLVGLFIVNVIVKYLHHHKSWRFFPAKMAAMTIFMIYNFIANNFITFAR